MVLMANGANAAVLNSQSMRDVVQAVASAAHEQLQAAREMQDRLPPPARLMLMLAVGAGMYLRTLEVKGFNLFDKKMLRSGYSKLACEQQLKWALLRQRF